jgi:hypothetical protein
MPTEPLIPPRPGLEREEPELATEEDIPTPANDDPEEVARKTEVRPQQP